MLGLAWLSICLINPPEDNWTVQGFNLGSVRVSQYWWLFREQEFPLVSQESSLGNWLCITEGNCQNVQISNFSNCSSCSHLLWGIIRWKVWIPDLHEAQESTVMTLNYLSPCLMGDYHTARPPLIRMSRWASNFYDSGILRIASDRVAATESPPPDLSAIWHASTLIHDRRNPRPACRPLYPFR